MASLSIDEIDRISAMPNGPERNFEITRTYHLLSAAIAGRIPGGCNWCTYAAWASRQAGQTIRRQDLTAALMRHPLLGAALKDFHATTGISQAQLAPVVDAVLREIEPFRQASEAVGRGNRKVFAEIAREFARFLRDFPEGAPRDEMAIDDFTAVLVSGPPPDGQDLLKTAFRHLYEALYATGKARIELLLMSNLYVGLHEQERLQPEILESLDAAASASEPIKAALFNVTPHAAMVREIRTIARIVVTQKLMTLELPGETLRLGQDLAKSYPPSLLDLENDELRALVAQVDPNAAGTAGSGALEWANFNERMNFIAELFRTHHETAALFLEPS